MNNESQTSNIKINADPFCPSLKRRSPLLIINCFVPLVLFFVFFLITDIEKAYAENETESCDSKCHLNPQFTKEDKNTREECAQCHSVARGPQPNGATAPVSIKNLPKKQDATSLLHSVANYESGSAEAAEIQSTGQNINLENMAYIPEGEFIMGTDDRLRDEKPAHTVYTDDFYIDTYEITNKDYKKFVDSTRYQHPDHWKRGTYPNGKAKHPVTFVSWHDAMNYCKWIGKRLPKEIEWEKAARGTDGRVYPWGDKWDMYKSNNPLRELGDTQPIGTYEDGKSPYGLYDMSGNVWEWIDDHYYAHPGSDYVNPEFGKKYRLLKGGSFWDCSAYGCGISAPVYNRAFFEPPVKGKTYGFRCAVDADKEIG